MKFIYLLSVCALTLSLVSCNDQPKETNTTVIERTIEVETPKTVVVEEKKSTSVTLSPDGSSLKTNKVDIKVNK